MFDFEGKAQEAADKMTCSGFLNRDARMIRVLLREAYAAGRRDGMDKAANVLDNMTPGVTATAFQIRAAAAIREAAKKVSE